MNAQRWQHIKSVVQAALTLAQPEREDYLTYACHGDETVRNEIEGLLRAIEASEKEEFLEKPGPVYENLAAELSEKWLDISYRRDMIGQKIGPFRLTKLAGTGGMGAVFKAERTDGYFRQVVAVKLIRAGVDSDENRRRFRMEQEILARLHHPNIARLYDGGIVPGGTPYLIMEFVEGIPVDEYCNRNRLSLDARLELFRDVCLAVQYAHTNLVIHRDLKPQNILVTREGIVKILDFGVAKFINPEATEITLFETLPGQKLWTPQYAAPEQVKGEAITTATDVYALGIILHKLLTDTWPLDFRNKNLAAIERTIIHSPPAAPSRSVSASDIKTCAALRGVSPSELIKSLTGDLDALVLRAIRKEPEYRYHSAGQLLDELDRYRKGLPLMARKGTFKYRARKFVARNRWAVFTAFILFFALGLGLVGTIWQAKVAERERDLARLETAKARAAQDYLIGLFEEADPARMQGETVTVHELVQRGIERLSDDLEAQPEVHVEMLRVLGRIQQTLGNFNLSSELLEQALDKTRKLRGNDHLDVAAVAVLLGDAARWNGELETAESLLREALMIRRNHFQEDNADMAANMDRLARVLEMRGNFDEAENLYHEALEMRERLFGGNSDAVSATLSNLGWLLHQTGRKEAAEEALRRSLQIRQQILNSPHPALASTQNNLAVVLRSKGSYEEALYFFERALEQERQLHGDDHPRITTAMSNLSQIHLDLARYEEAASQYRRILENNRRQLGHDHIYVGFALGHLAMALTEDGRSDEALPLIEEMLDLFRNAVGEEHRFYTKALMIKGYALYGRNPVQAAALLDQASALFRRTAGAQHPDLAEALSRLGWALLAAGELIKAEEALNEALEIQRKVHLDPHTDTVWTLTGLGRVLKKQGRFTESEKLLREAVELADEALPAEHWRRIAARLEYTGVLIAAKENEDTRSEIKQVLALLQDRTDYHALRLLSDALELQSLTAE